MKDYFNEHEKAQHLILMSSIHTCNLLLTSKHLTDEERESLNIAVKYIDKFSSSVCKRFGKSYLRKLQNTMKSNKIRLVGKYEKAIDAVSECVIEDMMPMINKYRSWQCLTCEKKDPRRCFIYNACTTCGIAASTDNDEDCPFKL